jgi:hypothetical protein
LSMSLLDESFLDVAGTIVVATPYVATNAVLVDMLGTSFGWLLDLAWPRGLDLA